MGATRSATDGTVAVVLAIALGAVCASPARGEGPARAPAIPAGSTERALAALAAQGDEQILFDPRLVQGRRSPAVPPGMPLPLALERALAGTGLSLRRVGPGVLVVVPDAAPAPVAATGPDVVVTALRRPTLLSGTNASLVLVSAETIAARRLTDQQALARVLPELAVTPTGPLQRRLAIRGVSGTGEGTVGVYIGETPVSAPGGTGADPAAMAPDIDLVDVERVELLKGPQGTLYGASSMGGTLRTLFRRPEADSVTAEVAVEGGITARGAPTSAASAILNVPLVQDRLAARGVIARRRSGGVIDNPRLGYVDGDAVTRESERLTLTWTPAHDIRLDLIALAQRQRIDDAGAWRAADGRDRAAVATRPRSRSALSLVSGTLQWSPRSLRVTATVSRYRWTIVRELDFSEVIERQRYDPAACARVTAAGDGIGCDPVVLAAYVDARSPALLHQPMTVRSTSGELRVSDGGAGSWRWTLGVFAEHRRESVDSFTLRANAATGGVLRPFDVTGLRSLESSLDQQAVFAEVERDLTDALTLVSGARLFRYVRAGDGAVPVANLLTGTGGIASGARYRSAAGGSNLKAALNWRIGSDTLARLVVSEGFRPGGVNITPELSADERVYQADHLWNYELGVRSQRLGTELAAFHIDWDDTIVAANSVNGAFLYNTNLVSVDINGIEALASRSAGPARFTAALAWVDARLAADTLLGTSEGIGHRGDRMPNMPAMTIMLSGETRLSRISPTLAIGAAVAAASSSRSTFNATSPYHERTPSRVTVDLFARWSSCAWSLRVGIDNAFDADAITRIKSSAFGERQVYTSRPRTASLTIARSL
ncbi:TonB-dependent receptor [Sphingomonas sp. BK069]|uniref:TonB-dependent receptor domain-containing protein n=1 Tax=Sphingomonas sp. BK069 TaxID=2586979 RepID=UPI001614A2F2|nr:TonB-dependent receptor [Sphingomonas sp. BK069]MBB3347217.1 outer membrane receptor protein involved in Fe transport [Sphingomonas sp. BK069]